MEPASASAGHGSAATYITGFVASVLLTIAAFALVEFKLFSAQTIFIVILGAAIVQMFVHLTLFLHLNRSSAQRWNVVVLAFAGLILIVLISGSLWIMGNANKNMMPPADMQHSEM
jgi:cytochrome o ubiquinol oxidase operon protein cyoD